MHSTAKMTENLGSFVRPMSKIKNIVVHCQKKEYPLLAEIYKVGRDYQIKDGIRGLTFVSCNKINQAST